jgi:uroporphyrinogen III methyltransferase/synthase
MTGRAYLVGAGPGDPELLTLKGLRALQEADVVVYDRLANPRLLDYARPQAERIYVGKEAQRHAMTQEEINALLVERTRQGNVVCRLKGGDPFVFGRGGEEAEALHAAGLRWEYVPGVTSAIGVPGYAGIPVTHRGLCSAFAVVTAHEDPTKPESTIRWKHLAAGVDTLVFLMGVERLATIVELLLENGRSPETPAAVISWGTFSRQRTVEGTLADIVSRCDTAGLNPPAVTIVGEVAALRDRLRWFDNRPLFDKRIIVTRPREQADELARRIEAAGGEALLAPSICIQAVPEPDLSGLEQGYDWVVFTSVNGVQCFRDALRAEGYDLRRVGNAKIAAIGPETTRAVERAGLKVDFVPSRYVAEQVLAEFPEPLGGKRVLLPRARVARELLPELWRQEGATVDVVPVYESVPDETGAEGLREQLAAREVEVVTFTASSTVEGFLKRFGDLDLSYLTVACIGPITAETARKAGLHVDVVAEEYTVAGLIQALEAHFGVLDTMASRDITEL